MLRPTMSSATGSTPTTFRCSIASHFLLPRMPASCIARRMEPTAVARLPASRHRQDRSLTNTEPSGSGHLFIPMSKLIVFCFSGFLFAGLVSAQVAEPDRLMQAFPDRAMADQVARMKTDERIKMYEALVSYKSEDFHYQNLLAATFIQKMRETMDPGYLDRASRIVDSVLAAEAYQRMVSLRPDLSSYNRASYYRFVAGDAPGAIEVMKRAIDAGSRSAE